MTRVGVGCCFILALALAGCGDDDVGLALDVRTDFRPGVEFQSVHVEIERPSQTLVTSATTRDDYLAGVRVAEVGGLGSGEQVALLASLVDGSGDTVASRPVRVELGSSGTTGVVIVITRDCRGVTCPGPMDPTLATACHGGACTDPGCTVQTPERCPAPECTAGADCGAPISSCAAAQCTTGVCVAVPDDATCGPGELCIPDLGCTTGAGDAGPEEPDAGGVDAGLAFDHNVVFVTSSAHMGGTLGDVARADGICEMRAAEAGLPGTFVAYLSTAAADAPTRLGAARGWVRPDGRPVADQVSDVAMARLRHPIRLHEDGTPGPTGNTEGQVFTGTDALGVFTGNDCGGWTDVGARGTSGRLDASGSEFTARALSSSCADAHRLYCFGTDRSDPLPAAPPVSGPIAFVTAAPWSPAGGVAAADAVCQSDAMAAGLAGTFLAVLSTGTRSAAERFDASRPVWVRPDGYALGATRDDVFDENLLAPPRLTADGTAIDEDVWAGAEDPRSLTADPLNDSCSDWTSSRGPPDSAQRGTPQIAGSRFFDSGRSSCSLVYHLLCFER